MCDIRAGPHDRVAMGDASADQRKPMTLYKQGFVSKVDI